MKSIKEADLRVKVIENFSLIPIKLYKVKQVALMHHHNAHCGQSMLPM